MTKSVPPGQPQEDSKFDEKRERKEEEADDAENEEEEEMADNVYNQDRPDAEADDLDLGDLEVDDEAGDGNESSEDEAGSTEDVKGEFDIVSYP